MYSFFRQWALRVLFFRVVRTSFRLFWGSTDGFRWVTSLLSLLLAITIMVKTGLSWNMYSSFTKRGDADVQYQNLMHVSRELFQCFYTCAEDCRKEFGGAW